MQLLHDASSGTRTGYALFDSEGVLVDANPEFFAGKGSRQKMRGLRNAAVVAQASSRFRSFDGRPVEPTAEFMLRAAERWNGT